MPTTSGRRPPIPTSASPNTSDQVRLGTERHRARGGGGGHLVQAVLLVVLGELVAEALPGDDVHQHRAAEVAGPAQRCLDRLLVVAVDRAEVLEAQVLEQHLRLQDVLEAFLHAVQGAVQRAADDGRAGQRGLDVVQHVLVALVDPEAGQVVGQAADGRLVGPAVVVDHDDQPAVLGHRDVVQRLPGHAAGQGTVPDDGDHGPVGLAAQPVRLGQPVGVGQAGGRVRVLHQVMLGLGPARVPGQAAPLPQRAELAHPAGEQLVHVGLVPGVENDLVYRRVEHPVQGDGQLHHAQVGPQVAAGPRHDLDQQVPDFTGQDRQLAGVQLLHVARAGDGFQQGHLCCSLISSAWPPGSGLLGQSGPGTGRRSPGTPGLPSSPLRRSGNLPVSLFRPARPAHGRSPRRGVMLPTPRRGGRQRTP